MSTLGNPVDLFHAARQTGFLEKVYGVPGPRDAVEVKVGDETWRVGTQPDHRGILHAEKLGPDVDVRMFVTGEWLEKVLRPGSRLSNEHENVPAVPENPFVLRVRQGTFALVASPPNLYAVRLGAGAHFALTPTDTEFGSR